MKMTWSEYFIGTTKYKWGHLFDKILCEPGVDMTQLPEFEPAVFIHLRFQIERETFLYDEGEK
jgi:hypothetical protein